MLNIVRMQGDVIYLHEPLVWTLRQHTGNDAAGPDALARAIGAVTTPLLDITARVGKFLSPTWHDILVAEYGCG